MIDTRSTKRYDNIRTFSCSCNFYSSCVYFSFRSGEKSGRVQMVEDMIDRGIVKTEDLIDKYNIEETE